MTNVVLNFIISSFQSQAATDGDGHESESRAGQIRATFSQMRSSNHFPHSPYHRRHCHRRLGVGLAYYGVGGTLSLGR